jgi:type IV pilus assembly protein PilP
MNGTSFGRPSVVAAFLFVFGCAAETPTTTASSASRPPPVLPTASAAKAAEAAKAAAPPVVEFQETDFTESERSRDPFRSFAKMFAEEARTKIKSQREVVLDQYSLDELKLVGIVTRVQPERALVIDPTGKGHIITRGQFVGRAEIVQGGASGADYEINWRVERIREADIVLVRDDPKNPDVPSATRIIALRTETPEAALGL